MKNKIDWEDLVSGKELSEIFGVEESYFRQLIKNGKIEENVDCKKIGKTWVFSKRSLEYFFANKR